jgi:hypothetical protein
LVSDICNENNRKNNEETITLKESGNITGGQLPKERLNAMNLSVWLNRVTRIPLRSMLK